MTLTLATISAEIREDYSLWCSHHPNRVATHAAVALRGGPYNRGAMWRYCAQCAADFLTDRGRVDYALEVRFVRMESGQWRRLRRGTDGADESFCAGPDDYSSPPEHYDSRCGWCYLGASHTEHEHARKVTS